MNDCACSMGEEIDYAEFSTVEIRKARKPYKCCECGKTIPVGEKYESASGLWKGEFGNFHTCIPCQTIRDTYFCEYAYGELQDAFFECFGFDYLGEIESDDGD